MQRKRYLFAAIIMLFAMLALFQSGQAEATDANWTATYWNNRSMTGTAALVRTESTLDHDWGYGAPAAGVVVDNFSAIWEKEIYFAANATYRFTATMDDGMRVYVDDNLIIDSWFDSATHTVTHDTYLNAGDHDVRVEYYESGGEAVAKLTYQQVGTPSPGTGIWQAEYYNNPDLAGQAVVVRNEDAINHDWGIGAPVPGVGADNFSARWTSTQYFDSGTYDFNVTVDDGVRLWVNGVLLIDEWHFANVLDYNATITLPGGNIPIRMEYFEGGGGAVAQLDIHREEGGATGPWYTEYFNNTSLEGDPVLTRHEGELDHDWGVGSPGEGVSPDNFSASWSQNVNFTEGRYRFTVHADDGVRLFVFDRHIITDWNDAPPRSLTAEIDLPAGTHPVALEYFEHTGGAEVSLSWTRIGPADPTTPPTTPPPAPGDATGTVLSALLNVRSGPGLEYEIVDQLVLGEVVALSGYRSENGRWVTIIQNGQVRWISALDYLLETNVSVDLMPVYPDGVPAPGDDLPVGEPTALIGNAYYLNVRSGPGVENDIITTLASGTRVELLSRNAGTTWIRIEMENGETGWVSANYLVSPTIDLDNLPLF